MNSYVCVCACFGVINWSRIFIAAGIGFCKHPVSLSQRPLNTHTRTLVSFTHTAAKRTALTSTVCVCLRGRLWFGGPSCNHATLRSRAKALREKVSGRGGQWVQSYQRRVYVLCIRQRKAEQVCERETLCDSLWSCPVCYCVFLVGCAGARFNKEVQPTQSWLTLRWETLEFSVTEQLKWVSLLNSK